MTGLPFVYAFWAGRPDALTPTTSRRCSRRATRASTQRDDGRARLLPAIRRSSRRSARATCGIISSTISATDERAGLELFYRYAAEAGVVPGARALRSTGTLQAVYDAER